MPINVIYKCLMREFRLYDYKLMNSFVFDWESDFFAISNSNCCVEVEVKSSKESFTQDFRKVINGNILKHDYLNDASETFKPNKFYFAFPEGLIKHSLIPEKYGIIECNGSLHKIVRHASLLHEENLLENNVFLKRLLDKFYYKWRDFKRYSVKLC